MIEAIITDLDGTLVDTYKANYMAYKIAFAEVNLVLTPEKYRECFGLRFNEFMLNVGVANEEVALRIKESKKLYYPTYFEFLSPNTSLIELIKTYKHNNLKTAVASTARRDNLMNVLNFLAIADLFDVIYAGEDVRKGKPSPEIYLKVMSELRVSPENTLIFEDSQVGLQAAKSSGAHLIKISL